MIDCIESSSCWISTTSYSADCDYYATITANFSAYSSIQSQKTLCAARWDSFFDTYLGGEYVTVTVAYDVASCGKHRRALLAGPGESHGETKSESKSEHSEGGSTTTKATVNMQITVDFYSAYSYSVFYNYLSTETLISGFDSSGYVANTDITITCLTTKCCTSNVGLCTHSYDVTLCNQTAPPTPAPTLAAKTSSAMTNKTFILFNFIIINVILYACLF